MDFLRILSMIMVTMLHALGKGGLLLPMSAELPLNGWVAWILECFSVGAVNIFMLLSGYYLIQSGFRIKRLWELLFQVLFYSVGVFAVYGCLGLLQGEQRDIYHLLQYFLPVHMEVYWFITSYVVIYLFLPVLTAGVRGVSRIILRNTIWGLLIYECVFKSILPFQLETDSKGYSFLWYLIMFLIGAYIRLYGFPVIRRAWQGWLVFLGGSLLIFAETAALHFIYAKTGRLEGVLRIGTNYNHIFDVLASIGIFLAFLYRKPMGEKKGSLISRLSSYALGVYLFQESILIRYEWQKWFSLPQTMTGSLGGFLLRVFGAVAAMFCIGIVIDVVRWGSYRGLARLFRRKKTEEGAEES